MTDPEKHTNDESGIPLEPSEKKEQATGPAPAISEPPLTEGMSEAELRAIEREETPPEKTKRPMRVTLMPDVIPATALGAPGRLGWRFPLIAGGAAILAAVVMAGVYAPDGTTWWSAALRQLIDAPLYAWVGVGAVLATSQLTERAFGGVYFVLARMIFAVGELSM